MGECKLKIYCVCVICCAVPCRGNEVQAKIGSMYSDTVAEGNTQIGMKSKM